MRTRGEGPTQQQLGQQAEQAQPPQGQQQQARQAQADFSPRLDKPSSNMSGGGSVSPRMSPHEPRMSPHESAWVRMSPRMSPHAPSHQTAQPPPPMAQVPPRQRMQHEQQPGQQPSPLEATTAAAVRGALSGVDATTRAQAAEEARAQFRLMTEGHLLTAVLPAPQHVPSTGEAAMESPLLKA